jgi:hypothetical protein
MTEFGQNAAFARFLGATVGKDRRAIDVTVLSMLARLNVDPRDEASELFKMPDASARRRFNALVARFSDVPTLASDRGKIVTSLLALLPRK